MKYIVYNIRFFSFNQGARLELVTQRKRKEEQAKRDLEKQVNMKLKSLRKCLEVRSSSIHESRKYDIILVGRSLESTIAKISTCDAAWIFIVAINKQSLIRNRNFSEYEVNVTKLVAVRYMFPCIH